MRSPEDFEATVHHIVSAISDHADFGWDGQSSGVAERAAITEIIKAALMERDRAATERAAKMRVKQLEWVFEDDDWWGASALGLVWEVRQARASVRARFPGCRQFEVFDGTLAEAKAAAQADFETRIAAAIRSQP